MSRGIIRVRFRPSGGPDSYQLDQGDQYQVRCCLVNHHDPHQVCPVQELPCRRHCQCEESAESRAPRGNNRGLWCPSGGPGACQVDQGDTILSSQSSRLSSCFPLPPRLFPLKSGPLGVIGDVHIIVCFYCHSKISVVKSNRPYDLKNSEHVLNPV